MVTLTCTYFHDSTIIAARRNEKGSNTFAKKLDTNESLAKGVLIKKRFFSKVVGAGFKASTGQTS